MVNERVIVTKQTVNFVIQHIKDRIHGLMSADDKNKYSFLSIHEAYGKIHEELKELEALMLASKVGIDEEDPKVIDELVDLAVTTIFSAASIISHQKKPTDTQ